MKEVRHSILHIYVYICRLTHIEFVFVLTNAFALMLNLDDDDEACRLETLGSIDAHSTISDAKTPAPFHLIQYLFLIIYYCHIYLPVSFTLFFVPSCNQLLLCLRYYTVGCINGYYLRRHVSTPLITRKNFFR